MKKWIKGHTWLSCKSDFPQNSSINSSSIIIFIIHVIWQLGGRGWLRVRLVKNWGAKHPPSLKVDMCSCQLIEPLVGNKHLSEGLKEAWMMPRFLDSFNILWFSDGWMFIHFLQIHSQCLPPTFLYSPHSQCLSPPFILSVLLPTYSQCPPPMFFYSPQPPHNIIVFTHIYPPGVASPFMHLVGFWSSQLNWQSPALQWLGPISHAHL